jgi:hypothetical protein
LVSVSNDGDEVPAIFVYQDILTTSLDSSFKPSPVDQINGEDAVEYLLNWSTIGSLQDRDALWNNVFYSLAQVSLGSSGTGTGTWAGGGRGRLVYPGPVTTLTFENGTTVTYENFARVMADFTNITSGQDIYNTWFIPNPENLPITLFGRAANANIEKEPGFPGWPVPSKVKAVVAKPGYPSDPKQTSGSDLAGYYLNKPGYEDVAVLAVASFEGSEGQENFQSASRAFLSQAKVDGKKKLIIDVSANAGGTIWVCFNLRPKPCSLNSYNIPC